MSSTVGYETEPPAVTLQASRTVVVEVVGASMTPTLPVGARLVIGVVEVSAIVSGDVVLFAGDPHPVIHRVLHIARVGSRVVLFHRGDAGDGIGVADGRRVLGRVVAVLAPSLGPVPALHALPPRLRRSFARAVWVARLAAVAGRLGVSRRVLPGWLRRAAERLLP